VRLESLRLWPTTPAILRDTTEETRWPNRIVERDAAVLIFAPFFHRDDWTEGRAKRWPLVPFSEGPAECPGRNLVLLTTSCLLARLIAAQAFHQAERHALRSDRPLARNAEPVPPALSRKRLTSTGARALGNLDRQRLPDLEHVREEVALPIDPFEHVLGEKCQGFRTSVCNRLLHLFPGDRCGHRGNWGAA